MDKDKLAKEMYDTYCEAVGGLAFNGDKLPGSEEFFNDPTKEKQANAWRKAAEPAKKIIIEALGFLGNPAYGISSSITFAADEFRDKTFDFLGVPKD